jgi:two-component system, NtrC family, response regulator HydG
MERAVAVTRGTELHVDALPEKVRTFEPDKLVIDTDSPEAMPTLDEMVRRYIRRGLAACQGNKSLAAKVLGLDRRTLYRRLESLQISDR